MQLPHLARVRRAILCLVAVLPALAWSQATVIPDGKLRYSFGLGGSHSSGNTSATNVHLDGDGVHAIATRKWSFAGRALWSRSSGAVTADQVALTTQYSDDIDPDWYAHANADYLRDRFANIASRGAVHAGLGMHLLRRDEQTWGAQLGVGYTYDRYVDAVAIDGSMRARFGRCDFELAQDSRHRLGATTTLRQRLVVLSPFDSDSGTRSLADLGIAVAMSRRWSLTVGLTYRSDTKPGAGFEHHDVQFLTGIAVKVE